MLIPPFGPDGLLPRGDHEVSFAELRRSPLVVGPLESDEAFPWDVEWRAKLVDNLEILTKQLWRVGIVDVFADGSFAEDKSHPNDIDGYFTCTARRLISGTLVRDLNLLDEGKVWNWSPRARREAPGFPKKQLPMWHAYRVELYPHVPGWPSGICDERGFELEFPSAFRQTRHDYRPKGIIRVIK